METKWNKNFNGCNNWWLDSKESILTPNSYLPLRTVCFGGVEQVNKHLYFAWIVNPLFAEGLQDNPFLDLGIFLNLEYAQRKVNNQFNSLSYI